MRLVGAHVENFGVLCGYDVSFEPGITVIKENNGFGKSTLAAFIRVMLYGMPRAAGDISKNDRKHYSPWQGGAFGGNLTFETDGRAYRIERFFGNTPKSDSFKLIDVTTGEESTRFSENVGEELFGLDADSFMRSTYIPQGFSGGISTDNIQAKIGGLVDEAGDMSGFDVAVRSLRERRTAICPLKGKGGEFFRDTEKVRELMAEADAIKEKASEIPQIKENIKKLGAEIKEKEAALARVSRDAAELEEKERHEALIRENVSLMRRNAQENADEIKEEIGRIKNAGTETKSMRPAAALLICGIILIAAGAALLVMNTKTVGVVFIAAGAVFLANGIVRRAKTGAENKIAVENARLLHSLEKMHGDAKKRLESAVQKERELQSNRGDSNRAKELSSEKSRLAGEISAMQRESIYSEKRIDDISELEARAGDMRGEIKALREKIKEEEHTRDLLDKTIELLTESKKAVSERYLSPVRERFGHYARELLGVEPSAASVDTGLGIKIDRGGALRELGYMSAGRADALMICMRLALVDVMFPGEKPPLILDDPFVNLDDENTSAALSLLRRAGRERQVIYLVCNSGRCQEVGK